MRPESDTTRLVRALASLTRPVLLLGARGTGKTTLARRLHELSGRPGPFVAVNCAALSETLFESEIFGHEKGSFTGALSRRAGRFELADRGTLFLDEIGELPPHLQAKLLDLAESGEVWAVGAARPLRVNVRVVAATNRPAGSLRDDLRDRFVGTLTLAPLAARLGEPGLVEAVLVDASKELGRVLTLAPDARAWIRAYEWPGNLRQLRNALLLAGALADGPIRAAELAEAVGASVGRDALADACTGLPEWFSAGDLASASGVSRVTARRWLEAHAEHNGLATKARLWRVRRQYGATCAHE